MEDSDGAQRTEDWHERRAVKPYQRALPYATGGQDLPVVYSRRPAGRRPGARAVLAGSAGRGAATGGAGEGAAAPATRAE